MNKKIFIFAGIILLVILLAWTFQYVKELPKHVDYYDEEVQVNDPTGELRAYYTIQTLNAGNKTLESLELTAENFPYLDGATASQPIRALIACETFELNCNWYENDAREMFLKSRTNSTSRISQQTYIEILEAKVEKNSKTHDAYLKLIRGEIDIILVSTEPSLDELEVAQNRNVKLELTPIGMDGLIFIVNTDNEILNLSTQDIINIYSGNVKNWEEFTGVNTPITAFTRPENSGSQELMKNLVMKHVPMEDTTEEERVIQMMGALIEGVESRSNSIGYSLYYYKNTMIDKRIEKPNVKLISIDGIEANPENIASNKYPFVFKIYAVTRYDEPKDSKAYQVKEWLTSEEGQEVIQKAGYVSLND